MISVGEHIAMTSDNGPKVPAIVSGDYIFRSLIRSIRIMRDKGTLTDDDAFASIDRLVSELVLAAAQDAKSLPFDVVALDDEEVERAFDQLTADVYTAVGEPEMARLYLEDRAEFERRCAAGTPLEEKFLR